MSEEISQHESCPNISIRMIRKNMKDIPQYAFPEGFSIRSMHSGDETVWAEIVRETMSVSIAEERFSQEFGEDMDEMEQRIFFILNSDGCEIGTISAWHWPDLDGRESGLIHWVAILPSYQGYGLGKAAMTHAMNRMAELHDRCFLHTSTARLPAVKVYLDFGFELDMTANGADEARDVIKQWLNR